MAISFEEQSRERKLCSHLGRENWKNTHQVTESHCRKEGRSKCAVNVCGVNRAKLQCTCSSNKLPQSGAR